MTKKVGSEMFDRDNSTDFEIPHSQTSEVILAAEQRDSVKRAIFFDDPYGYGDETMSADVRLCTTEW